MKPIIDIEQIAVNPSLIDVMDVEYFRMVGTCLRIKPSYYQCELQLSPYVLQLALKWLLENDYIHLRGKLTIPIRKVRYDFTKPNKEENDET